MAHDIGHETDEKGSLAALIYDPKARGLLFQIILLLAVIGFFAWVLDNTITNLAAQNKKSGFGFLGESSGFQILTTLGTFLVESRPGQATYLDIFWIGVINTLAVAILGIIFATILGFTIGIFRLSSNVILRGFATVYVELGRNIPLLLQILFFYIVVLRLLPGKREEGVGVGFFGLDLGTIPLNITGLYLPFPVTGEGFGTVMLAFLGSLVLAWIVGWLAKKRQEATGQQFPSFWVGLALIVGITLVAFYMMGGPLTWEHPEFRSDGPVLRRGYQSGVGAVIVPEFIALWLSLSLYTASFIAEIVRAGILAVPNGQTEASKAVGMSNGQNLRLVVIPQALRVIIPPLTSQYLNLTKNSSLAVAIAYPDIVSVFAGTALNQVGQEIEMIFMMMMVYLVISLVTSAFMNWFNDRMRLVER
jgi:general L-amino acid transport system permease protein